MCSNIINMSHAFGLDVGTEIPFDTDVLPRATFRMRVAVKKLRQLAIEQLI